MALSRRTGQRFQASIWPGFVDAMTALLLVLMFVLTIFMVVQSVLRETISGQETELDELTSQVLSLADALGLEKATNSQLQGEIARLSGGLLTARNEAEVAQALIASLTAQTDAQSEEIARQVAALASFEVQVASLLSQREAALAQGEVLATSLSEAEAQNLRLIGEQEALQLALASARDEIDSQIEAARLAAAQREALDAMIADLQSQNAEAEASLVTTLAALRGREEEAVSLAALLATKETAAAELAANLEAAEAARLAEAAAVEALQARLAEAENAIDTAEIARLAELAAAEALRAELADKTAELSAEEAARLADIAAAEALRERLANSDAELTAMSLALEEKRQEAEDTLTLLAAAKVARDGLDQQLAAALAAQTAVAADLENQRTETASLNEQLAAALLAAKLAQNELGTTEEALAAARASLETLKVQGGDVAEERARLQDELTRALAAQLAAETSLGDELSKQQVREALLATANEALAAEEAKSAESLRQMALLSEQIAALDGELGVLQNLLDESAAKDAANNVQIEALGSQLNTALAQVASEERKRRKLEEAERKRLEIEAERLAAEAVDLERYRSEFFGRMRALLGATDGIRIEGDRFVFSSEVLFESAAAELSPQGRVEIAKVAAILRSISDQIPTEIDWVIRVDGHTDNIPLSGTGRYRDNWELSQGRALSVVRFMVAELGIAPDRLSANGFGEFQPVNDDNTREARAQNRRIELKLTEK